MMQPGQTPSQPGMPAQPGGNTITIDMQPGGSITLNSAQGSKQCESIGECLQTLLEMYEAMSGDGEGGEAAMMAGYADQAPQEARPIGGGAVK